MLNLWMPSFSSIVPINSARQDYERFSVLLANRFTFRQYLLGLFRVWLVLILLITANIVSAEQKGDAALPSGVPLKQSVSVAINSHQQSARSQDRIEMINEKTQRAADEYLANVRQLRITEAYNRQMRILIRSQDKEINDLQSQIDSIDGIERATLPMLNAMVVNLQVFIEQDTPFLSKERSQRIQRLQRLLDRADVSVAEKYRQILEAYMVEVSYGRTIEAYTSDSDEKVYGVGATLGGRHLVFFRLGRIALYYQTLNGLESGLWLPEEQRWQPLTESQNLVLRKAIQIARQQRVPELLDLPLPPINSSLVSSAH